MSNISQIDHYQHDVGKNNPESKREVIFLFEVDGEKYEVLLKWSFTSGKYSIFVNDNDVFFGTKKGASLMDQKFQYRDINFHLVGTRSIPKGAYPGSYNDFELLINGILFSNTPRRGETQARPMEGTESILDLLYPKLRNAAYELQCQRTQQPINNVQTPPPAPMPVTDLLNFSEPTAPDIRSKDMFSAQPAPAAPVYNHTAPTAVPDATMNGFFSTEQAPAPAAPVPAQSASPCPVPPVYNNTAPPAYNNNYAAPQGHNSYSQQSQVAPVITPANPFDAFPQASQQSMNTNSDPMQVQASNPFNNPQQPSYSAQPAHTVPPTPPAEAPSAPPAPQDPFSSLSSSTAYSNNPCATTTAASPWGAPAPATTSPWPANPVAPQSTPVDPFGGVF